MTPATAFLDTLPDSGDRQILKNNVAHTLNPSKFINFEDTAALLRAIFRNLLQCCRILANFRQIFMNIGSKKNGDRRIKDQGSRTGWRFLIEIMKFQQIYASISKIIDALLRNF